METSFSAAPQQDLLSDIAFNLEHASSGKRLANYLIDAVFFYVFIFLFFFVFALVDSARADELLGSFTGMNSFADRILSLILYGIFMGIIEGSARGKTLGKLITRTRAVNEDGTRISFKTGFLRGLSRAVPFDSFSALGSVTYPWHDKWTHTYVIDEKASSLPVS